MNELMRELWKQVEIYIVTIERKRDEALAEQEVLERALKLAVYDILHLIERPQASTVLYDDFIELARAEIEAEKKGTQE